MLTVTTARSSKELSLCFFDAWASRSLIEGLISPMYKVWWSRAMILFELDLVIGWELTILIDGLWDALS